ncbi:MFS transporter [Sulfobacillus harzensis]|uniref:MFS transporter n=1 Tax=Sulfobacillus harzensis TaxID=2729629 RepID=A0A7Y0L6H6_9FIRM|nr:MFS transporter [Sulfobacillus harzensis]NMP24115.1 MFS transporter [Sulfobacillus harzensis]
MADTRKLSLVRELHDVTNSRTLVLFASSLVVPLAAFMLYPFLIIYFTHVLKLSAAEAGLLLSVRFLSSGILGFVGGLAADRIGLGRTYVMAGLLTGLTVLAMSAETHVWPLVGLLVVLGVSASTVNAAARGLANTQVDSAHGGTVQNLIHWLNNVGMAAALPLSAFALSGGYSRIPFDVTAVAYMGIALLMASTFWEKHAAGGATAGPAKQAAGPWTILRQDPAFGWLLTSFLLVVAAEMQFESGVPLDLSYHFPHGAQLYGALGALDMVVVFVLQLGVSHWLARIKSPWPGYIGMLAVGGLVLGGIWQTVPGWTIAIILLGIGDVFAFGQIFALMGMLPRPGQQGQYFSMFTMVQGLATFIAYAASGAVYQVLHPVWLFGLTIPVAVLATLSFRNAKTLFQRRSESASEDAG